MKTKKNNHFFFLPLILLFMHLILLFVLSFIGYISTTAVFDYFHDGFFYYDHPEAGPASLLLFPIIPLMIGAFVLHQVVKKRKINTYLMRINTLLLKINVLFFIIHGVATICLIFLS